jgi:cell wall-associated NlpC family hydrolase
MPTSEEFVQKCMAQEGDDYVFGAETDPDDPDPDTFDCSELVEWACARLEVDPPMPDGARFQARHCQRHGTLIPVELAIQTRGALLFSFKGGDPLRGQVPTSAHVAVSLGDGNTIEARGSKYGVNIFDAREGRAWTHAGLVPGLDYGGEA